MCDWCSWIEKDGKIYFLRDDDIAAKWPNEEYRDNMGHSAIEIVYPESIGGKHIESPIKIPKEIAVEVGRGKMDKMMRAGGWAGARYSKNGNINSPWWKKVQAIVKECKIITYFSNSGEIKPEWKIFDTYSEAYLAAESAAYAATLLAAYSAAYSVARSEAYTAAYAAARSEAHSAAHSVARLAAYAAARSEAHSAADSAADSAVDSAALLARCEIGELADDNQHKIYAQNCMDVWRAGYGLLCDIDRVFYVYRRYQYE